MTLLEQQHTWRRLTLSTLQIWIIWFPNTVHTILLLNLHIGYQAYQKLSSIQT